MRKAIFYICLGASFFYLTAAQAQQDAQFSYYMMNQLYYNPAFAGVEGVTQITGAYRSQWTGYDGSFDSGGAPNTQLFSVTSPIYKFRSGFGAHVLNDNLGPINNLQVHVAYAYHLGIKKSKLSFGFKIGANSLSVDDEYRPIDPEDPLLDVVGESQVRPDMSVGVYFRSEKYYSGISFNHILESEFDFGINDLRNPLENHGYFMFGYMHQVNFDVKISPSLLLQTDFNEYNVMLGAIGYYRDQLWVGAAFRQAEDINLLLGYNFLKDKSLSFGYSFGYVIQDQDAKKPTSHEVLLSYKLPVNPGSGKKVIRTPRFRH